MIAGISYLEVVVITKPSGTPLVTKSAKTSVKVGNSVEEDVRQLKKNVGL